MRTTMFKSKVNICPTCKATSNSASNESEVSPSEGDFAICIECRAINVYGPKLDLEPASDEQLLSIDMDKVKAAVKLIERLKKNDFKNRYKD